MAGQQVRIFISSPGDVADERRRAAIVINRLAREFARFFELSAVLWEYEPMLASGHFQDAIVKPSDSDVVVMILWSRLGTPLPERYRGADGRAPVTGTEWEFEDALTHHATAGVPDLLVYRKDLPGRAEFDREEQLDAARDQWRALQAFWGRYFIDAGGGFKAAFNSFRDLDAFEAQLDQHLRQLLRQRLPTMAQRDQPDSILWTEGSPFRGLEAYQAEHAAIFFGREQAEREVTEALAGHAESGTAFLLLLGGSGTGKSSLIRAGVMPTLTAPGVATGVTLWRRVLLQPGGTGGDLFDRLARALIAQGLPELPAAGIDAAALAGQLRTAPGQAGLPIGVGLRAAENAERTDAPTAGAPRLILLVDQLEELFTLPEVTAEEREGFVALLAALATTGYVWIIATLRSDFYHRISEVAALRELAAERQYNLAPPRPAELGEIIRRPAAAAGIRYETDETSGLGLDSLITEAAGRDPSVLPLLSFALDELYRRDIAEAGGDRLTIASYGRLGGLEGAIAKRAEEVCAALPEAEVAAVLRELVTFRADEASARPAPLSDVATTPAREKIADALVTARLAVTSGGGAGGPTMRLAHEALIHHWPRLAELIVTDREFLRSRTRLVEDRDRWEREGRLPDLLLPSGRRLAEGAELLATRPDDLDRATAGFIEASVARDRAQSRRQLQRTRRFAGVVAVLGLAAIVFGVFADYQRRRAEQSFTAAVTAADALVTEVAARVKPLTGTSAATVRSILDTAEKAFDKVAAAAPNSPLLRWRRAILLDAFVDSYLALGDKSEALRRARAAEALMQALVTEDPTRTELQLSYAESHRWLGDVLRAQGDTEGALREYRASLAIRQDLVDRHPEHDEWRAVLGLGHGRLGYLLMDQQQYAAARDEFKAALDIREDLDSKGELADGDRRNIEIGHRDVGNTYQAEQKWTEALSEYRKALDVAGRLAAAQPANIVLQDDIASIHQRIGDVLLAQNDPAGALAEYRDALEITRQLAEQDPTNVQWLWDAHIDTGRLGAVRFNQGDIAGAVADFRDSVGYAQQLVGKSPEDARYQQRLFLAYWGLGNGLYRQGDKPAALSALEAAQAIAVTLDKKSPSDATREDLDKLNKAIALARQTPAK